MKTSASGTSIELLSLEKAKLRKTWRELFGAAPPNHLRADLLRRFISYRLQEQSHSGLASSVANKLRILARAKEADLLALQGRSLIKGEMYAK